VARPALAAALAALAQKQSAAELPVLAA